MQVYEPSDDSFLLSDEIKKFDLKGKRCLDMGTGSGIQAQAMIASGGEEIVCVDINYKALLASQKRNKCFSKISFIESDLFKSIPESKFDFIAFNPPYLPSDEMKFKDLDGGKKGREVIDKFLSNVCDYLHVGGYVLLLISSLNNLDEVLEKFEEKGFIAKVVSEKKLFFEQLFVISARKIN
jgi:release factor glutamine methyltransferase